MEMTTALPLQEFFIPAQSHAKRIKNLKTVNSCCPDQLLIPVDQTLQRLLKIPQNRYTCDMIHAEWGLSSLTWVCVYGIPGTS